MTTNKQLTLLGKEIAFFTSDVKHMSPVWASSTIFSGKGGGLYTYQWLMKG
jgi:hypothetical protein